ncbi:MAG TPA: sialidase family protein, partial [bacterium]|nr:sialidase family protein [bacterium]
FYKNACVSYNFTMINTIETGILYSNPKPHLKSVHAYFPSVAQLPDGKMIAVYALGEAFEAINLHTHVSFSSDNGKTWQYAGRLLNEIKNKITSDASRITALPEGNIVILTCVYDRTGHTEEGLTNPDTVGFVPTSFYLIFSFDGGKTFSAPQQINPPVTGPCFELCCPVTILSDGTWLIPTSTWKAWDGSCPSGMKAIAFISTDKGKNWGEYSVVMDAYSKGIIFWESKIIEMLDGNLVAVAWAYDGKNKIDLPNHFAISKDRGRTWTEPISTDLYGQTLTSIVLKNGKLLSVYRRMDEPGLWAAISRIEGKRWITEQQIPLWAAKVTGLTGNTKNPATDFHVLRFGAPSMIRLLDGSIFLAFWCYEQCISIIRWFLIREK